MKDEKFSDAKKRAILNYLLSRVFADSDITEKLHEITGRPEQMIDAEPTTELQPSAPVRFKALREKLSKLEESKDSDVEPASASE